MNAAGFPDYAIQGNGVTIPFNSGAPDAVGNYWYLEGGIAGWDSPEGRVTMLPKIGNDPASDGEYASDQHYRGRSFTFKLNAYCPSEVQREEAWYLLAQATDLIDGTGLFIVNEATPKQAVVSRSGNNSQGKLVMLENGISTVGVISRDFNLPLPGDANNSIYILSVQVELYSTDPRKYAQSSNTHALASNTATVVNAGNTPSQNFSLTITGGIGGISGPLDISLAGQTMQLIVPSLPAGAPPPGAFPNSLGIDFYNRIIGLSVGLNDYYYLRNLQTPWLFVPPGTSTLSVSGVGTLIGSVTYTSAWI